MVAVTVCCCTIKKKKKKKTALRVIMTTTVITTTMTIMYTALLFFLQLCGFSANFSSLWLTVMNYKSHERYTHPNSSPVLCAVHRDDGICGLAFISLQTSIKAYPYSPTELSWCLAVMWSEGVFKCPITYITALHMIDLWPFGYVNSLSDPLRHLC